MKTKVAILVFVSFLLFSCVPATPTQEDEVAEIATEEIVTEEPASQPVITKEPIVTDEPTETPIACVTLLTPVNGVEIPPVGKVTFSWTPIDEAGKYILNIILPSGEIVPFETDQSFHERYMEAFSTGGEYHWQVVAQGVDGSKICVSEISQFNKSAYNPPTTNKSDNQDQENNDENNSRSNDGNENEGNDECHPILGCGGQ